MEKGGRVVRGGGRRVERGGGQGCEGEEGVERGVGGGVGVEERICVESELFPYKTQMERENFVWELAL